MFRSDPRYVRLAKQVLPSPAKRVAAHVLRGYGIATGPLRALPDFLLVGAKRCGSTSLFTYLVEHPEVANLFPAASGKKGTHYFDRHSGRSQAWYRSHFAMRRSGLLTGEASTYYFAHPTSAYAAADLVPSAKVIALLREPAERAYSQYRDEVKNGNETLSFVAALAAEDGRLAPEYERMRRDRRYYSFVHEHLAYTAWGRYAEHLRRWLEAFPPEQVLVLRSEDMFTTPEAVYRRCTDFLGLAAFEPAFRRHNSAPPTRAITDTDAHAEAMTRLRRYYAPLNAELADLLPAAPSWT